MPQASNCRLFPVCPGKVAILTVKFFRYDFQCAKQTDQSGCQKFPRHLRVLDVRRVALWAANQRSGDVWISRFPLDHQTLRSLEIVVLHHDLRVRLRLGHKTELLHRRLIVDVGPDA